MISSGEKKYETNKEISGGFDYDAGHRRNRSFGTKSNDDDDENQPNRDAGKQRPRRQT